VGARVSNQFTIALSQASRVPDGCANLGLAL